MPVAPCNALSVVGDCFLFCSLIVFCLRSGAGKRPFRRFQVEQSRDHSGHLLLFLLLRKFLWCASQEAGNLLYNLCCDCMKRLILLPRERSALFNKGLQFLPANLFKALAEREDRRHHALRLEFAAESLRPRHYNLFRRGYYCGAVRSLAL